MAADALLGALFGFGVAVLLSVVVLGFALVRGSTAYPQYGADITTWRAIGLYLATGPVVGVALGLLRPMFRSRAGAAAAGYVGGVTAYGGIGVALDGFSSTTLGIALVLGVAGAIVAWQVWPDLREPLHLPNDR